MYDMIKCWYRVARLLGTKDAVAADRCARLVVTLGTSLTAGLGLALYLQRDKVSEDKCKQTEIKFGQTEKSQ